MQQVQFRAEDMRQSICVGQRPIGMGRECSCKKQLWTGRFVCLLRAHERTHDHDRARRNAKNLLRHGTVHVAIEAMFAMSAHNKQIGLRIVNQLAKGFADKTVTSLHLNRYAGSPHSFRRRFQLRSHLFFNQHGNEWSAIKNVGVEDGIYDMRENDPGSKSLGETNRPEQRMLRERRKIGGYHDRFEGG